MYCYSFKWVSCTVVMVSVTSFLTTIKNCLECAFLRLTSQHSLLLQQSQWRAEIDEQVYYFLFFPNSPLLFYHSLCIWAPKWNTQTAFWQLLIACSQCCLYLCVRCLLQPTSLILILRLVPPLSRFELLSGKNTPCRVLEHEHWAQGKWNHVNSDWVTCCWG